MGKTPNTAAQLDLNGTGYTVGNNGDKNIIKKNKVRLTYFIFLLYVIKDCYSSQLNMYGIFL